MYVNLKSEVEIRDFLFLNPCLFYVFYLFRTYAKNNGLPVLITSIASDQVIGRGSLTHAGFRGIDFSIDGWSKMHQERVCFKINDTLKRWLTGPVDKEWTVIKVHAIPGGADHFHAQVNKNSLIIPSNKLEFNYSMETFGMS